MILSNSKRCILFLVMVIVCSTSLAAGVRRPAGRRRQRRHLQDIPDARKMGGKGKGSMMGYFGEDMVDMQEDALLQAVEKDDKSKGKDKGKDKGDDSVSDEGDDTEDDSDESPISGESVDVDDPKPTTIIENVFGTPAPTFKATDAPTFVSTPSPSSEPTRKPTIAPSTPEPTTSEPTMQPTPSTPAPQITPQPTDNNGNTNQEETTVLPASDSPTTAAPTHTPTPRPTTVTTESPATDDSPTTPAPTLNNTGEEDGPFGGRDYYHRHLIPFAVSVEGDEVSNDLGITSCLLTEMQKNMTNLFNLDITNFTIVHFNDVDGDGYNRYDLYFAGFGELLGLPVYSQEYFAEVQLSVLGDGVEFYQTCLDNRYADSGQSYTASALEHDNPNGLEGNEIIVEDSGDGSDEDSELRTSLIIGLTVAAVVVALCGIIFASRVLRGDDEGSSAAGSRGKY